MRPSHPAILAELLANSAMLGARMAHISFAEWQRAVGPRLAKKAFPERLSDDGVLTVRVPSSTWAQELSLLSAVVLQRLQGGGHAVQRMRFQVHATPTRPEPPVTRVTRAELPDQLRATLDRVDDPELRRAIADAAAYSLARQR